MGKDEYKTKKDTRHNQITNALAAIGFQVQAQSVGKRIVLRAIVARVAVQRVA